MMTSCVDLLTSRLPSIRSQKWQGVCGDQPFTVGLVLCEASDVI